MGEVLKIWGGVRLEGEVWLPPAKNSVLPILAASLLCDGPVRLRQTPRLTDVENSLALLRAAGMRTAWEGEDLLLTPGRAGKSALPDGPVRAMRSSVFYLAPMLHRMGEVRMTMPGGCRLGPRPIDIHLEGLACMGAAAEWKGEQLTLSAPRGLYGAEFALRLPSVGATETLMMAAVKAKGITVLRGAAREPEVVDLARFLMAAGAHICGAGTSTIWIQGRERLSGAAFRPVTDRIVAATVLAAAAATGGSVTLRRCVPEHLEPVVEVLTRGGCRIRREGPAALTLAAPARLAGAGWVTAGAYPAFPTDAAPVLAAAFLTAAGPSYFEDTVFEHRFGCAAGFSALGGRAKVRGRLLELAPAERLQGAAVSAADLRGGAALAVAALQAQGESTIAQAGYIRRGYGDLAALLRSLGARAEWEEKTERENEGKRRTKPEKYFSEAGGISLP